MTRKYKFDGLILLGPFGSGKTYLAHQLNQAGIASYIEMEPIIYDLFGQQDEFDVEGATAYLRKNYIQQFASSPLVAIESTGLVQRPLLLDLIDQFDLALICMATPKDVCLARVARRNRSAKRPIEAKVVSNFYDKWHNEVALGYRFNLTLRNENTDDAINQIKLLASL